MILALACAIALTSSAMDGAYAEAAVVPGDGNKCFSSVHAPDYQGNGILAHCCSFLDRDNDPAIENSDTHQERTCQSLPNRKGKVIFMKHDPTAHDFILSMKKTMARS